MTALLNASTLQPAAAATGAVTGLFGAGVATQGPMAGFEALLTAFFGNQGAGEPVLGADGKPVSKAVAGAAKEAKEAKTAKDGKDAPEAAVTVTPSTDAQILAALLAQPINAPVPVSATVADEDAANGGGAPVPSVFGPQLPGADAALGQAQAGQAAKTADAKTAKAPGAVAQAAADAETAKALNDDATAEPAGDTAATAVASAFDAGKPAAARQPASAAAPASALASRSGASRTR